jgi:acyl dehydratase
MMACLQCIAELRDNEMSTTRATDLFLEDIIVGQGWETGSVLVTEDEIVAFARQFDPQPFHMDIEAARRSAFGGLIASGLHALSLTMRLFFDLNLWENAIIASPGMNEVRWLKPLRPEMTIWSQVAVADVKPSTSKADRGVVTTRHLAFSRSDLILSTVCMHMLRRRPAP